MFIRCACGKTFDGPDARSKHRMHFHIENSRAALKAADLAETED